MNEQEAQEMLKKWQKELEITKVSGFTLELNKDEIEQVIILLRSYLMTFEKGYPFD